MEPELRRAARLVVVDPDKNVLLFQYEDDLRTWWATPGGGLENEETFEDAALREASEELSLTCAMLVPLWRRTVEFRMRGQLVRQVESCFLTRVSRSDVALGPAVAEVHRREGIVAARWWSLEEIETTSERIYPEDLCESLRGLKL